MSAVLDAAALGKRYKRSWALRDCTLPIPAGCVTGLVGPNGAGKTTLLHLAVGLSQPDEGSVRVLGVVPDGNAALLGRIGFVAQDAPLYADFSAADLVVMGSRLNPRWDDPFARARLAHYGVPLAKPVGKLSGGQRAQVALTLALAKRPEALLLDEPVAGLDPLARREFLKALMGAVADEGISVVLASHLLDDLERVCDYLVILQRGSVQLSGTVDDLMAEHAVVVGPRDAGAPAGVRAVVTASHTDKQSTLLVRTSAAVRDPAWTVGRVSLEDLVLGYLAEGNDATSSGHVRAGVACPG
jgi:ABC-2 type transport system ATP-binding protein